MDPSKNNEHQGDQFPQEEKEQGEREDREDRISPTVAALRKLAPIQPVDFQDALTVADRQAEEFLMLNGIDPAAPAPTPTSIVENLPGFRVVKEDIGESGMTQRAGGVWLIVVNAKEVGVRNRFTIFHEFKHALDHHADKHLYTGRHWLSPDKRKKDAAKQREKAANFFAGCTMMPRPAVLHLWKKGIREPEELTEYFETSITAVTIRLEHLGLTRPHWMCIRGVDPNETVYDLPSYPSFLPTVQRSMSGLSTSTIETMQLLRLRPQSHDHRQTHSQDQPQSYLQGQPWLRKPSRSRMIPETYSFDQDYDPEDNSYSQDYEQDHEQAYDQDYNQEYNQIYSYTLFPRKGYA